MRIFLAFSGLPGDGITCDAAAYGGRGGSNPIDRLTAEARDGWVTVDNAVVGRDVDPTVPGGRELQVRLDRVAFVEVTQK